MRPAVAIMICLACATAPAFAQADASTHTSQGKAAHARHAARRNTVEKKRAQSDAAPANDQPR